MSPEVRNRDTDIVCNREHQIHRSYYNSGGHGAEHSREVYYYVSMYARWLLVPYQARTTVRHSDATHM